MKLKQNEWWMVIQPDGFALLRTAGSTKADAIREWNHMIGVSASNYRSSWRADRRKGYRCVKCKIEETT